jgi:hypothetical protein
MGLSWVHFAWYDFIKFKRASLEEMAGASGRAGTFEKVKCVMTAGSS